MDASLCADEATPEASGITYATLHHKLSTTHPPN